MQINATVSCLSDVCNGAFKRHRIVEAPDGEGVVQTCKECGHISRSIRDIHTFKVFESHLD